LISKKYEFDLQIYSYSNTKKGKSYPGPLLFWKSHESQFLQFAKIAKNYLAVPATYLPGQLT
jgi:hypothetical protein